MTRRGPAIAAVLALVLAGSACTTTPPIRSDTARPAAACADLFARVDAAVGRAGVRDAAAARIEGFPWLRVSRPLASFRDEVDTAARFEAWVERLAALDRQARRHELANLPAARREALAAAWQPAAARHELPAQVPAALDACRARLRTARLEDPGARARLREAAVAPDAYDTWKRVLGLYPLAWRVARPRVEAFQAERAEAFRDDLAGDAALQRYAVRVEPPADAAARARDVRRDALGIPTPKPSTRAALFAAHAPVWAIETQSHADRPGALLLDGTDRPHVDPGLPVEYRKLTWTRFRGDVLLQLNYLVWFAERPPDGWLDLYAGHLDGLLWRVTLGPDGTPLAWDSIHPCGCYYTLFPGTGWRVGPIPADEEPVSAPAQAPRAGPGERLVLGIEARTHYLFALDTARRPVAATPLAPLQMERLRSLPRREGGNASAFDEDGLIPSSARGERFYFWPLGVPSAGAMRQWGTHAIAFVGRRHFDDPFLLERLLAPDPQP